MSVMIVIGESGSPTPYKIKTPPEKYLRCGADILLNGVGADLVGESRCIVCGRETRIEIVQGSVKHVRPPGALLHVVEILPEHGSPEILCEGSPIFDTEACLKTWLTSYRGMPGQVYRLEEYMPRASQLVVSRVRPRST